jgi:phosphoribosylformylglycinamidine synthase
VDGQAMPHSLFDLVKAPWKAHPGNSVVAFKDNSSALRHACLARWLASVCLS